MGFLREGGIIGQIVGAVLIAVGTITTNPALATVGYGLMVASSVAVALDPPPPPSVDRQSRSRHYGWDQYRNPIGPDSVLPVVYSGADDGVRVAPVIVQAYLTPVDDKGVAIEGSGAVPSKDQKLTVMGVCSEGPCPTDWLRKLTINDQELFQEDISGESVGTGDGTTKKFKLPRKHLTRDSITIYVNAVKHAKIKTGSRTYLAIGVGNGDKKSWTVKEDEKDAVIDLDSVTLWSGYAKAMPSDQSWSVTGISDGKFKVKCSKKVPKGQEVRVSYTYAYTKDGVRINQEGGWTYVTISPAPTNGHAITYDGRVDNFEGVTLETRRGELNQAAIPGLNQIRNTYAPAEILDEATPITYQAKQAVDDLAVTISALQGMIQYEHGRDAGKTDSLSADVTVDYREIGDTIWKELPNPTDGGTSFRLAGETSGAKRWSIGLKATLKAAVAKGRIAQSVLDDFTRARYEVRVTRVDAVKAENSDQNRDRIWFQFVDEVQEETLTYPGVTYFVLRAVAAERLQGSLPRFSVWMKGREVKNLSTSAVANSGNPAWCLADLLTSTRYGAGISESDLVTADWTAWGSFCDASVTLDDDTTETRCRMDAVIDHERSPLAWATELAFPHFAIPVLKGKKWGVMIDRARDSDKTYKYSGATSNTAFDSLRTGVESRDRTPTEIEVEWNDEDHEHERQAILIPPETRSGYRQKKRISLIGCTRRTQAIRVGYHVRRGAELSMYVCEFTALPDGALSEAGDVILVQSEVGGWTTGKLFRVLRVGFDDRLRVKLLCREYSAQLYAKAVSSVPAAKSGSTPAVNTSTGGNAATGSGGASTVTSSGNLKPGKTSGGSNKWSLKLVELTGVYP